MSSHAELLSHSCSHCAQQNTFLAPVDLTVDHGQGIRGNCLWFKLAHAWIDKGFKNMLGLIKSPDDGHASLYREGMGYIGADGRIHVFEWMVPSQDGSDTFQSLDKKRRLTRFSGDTSSVATFNILKRWMADCESNHQSCGTKHQDDETLKGIRFLRIHDESVFLEENVVPARYACLSHCWGSVQNLVKTTQENRVVHMEDGIPIQNLPKTYRDSIVVCKELGINHLWIDSLCIIQNSSHDWSEQASRMAEVYQNAYVTLAAVAARNATEGLFNNISDRLTSVSLPGYPWIHIRRQAQLPSANDDFMDIDFDDGHTLYKRGWTFQELSLSPRVIHYGRNEVIWHCQSRSICEGDPDGSIEISSLVSANLIRESDLSIEGLWYSIVGAYSWRSLTFEKDRLPAIAAFASRIQGENHQKRYVHGLWEDSLRLDLLWSVDAWKPDHHSGPSSGLEPRNLPTWSWASVKTPIIWDDIPALNEFEEVPHTKIIEVGYETRGPPLLGDAIEAHIVIQAPIFKLSDIQLVKTSVKTAENKGKELVWYLPQWDTLFDATNYGKQRTEALAIPLIMMKRKMTSRYAWRFINSLVVAETSETGKYRRVGVAELGLQARVPWSATGTEYSEDEETEREVERERNYERFIEIMDQMEKRTIILI